MKIQIIFCVSESSRELKCTKRCKSCKNQSNASPLKDGTKTLWAAKGILRKIQESEQVNIRILPGIIVMQIPFFLG
jgi:hypothetical protein